MTLQTMGEGDVLGWLWFNGKPYHWHRTPGLWVSLGP